MGSLSSSLVNRLLIMPHSFGVRARTRDMFSRSFREKGMVRTSTYLTTFKVGDIVDVVANAAIHKGMPHKFYHGKTGVVWNVTRRAVGVMINKVVGNRIIRKKIHVRVEHVRISRSREDFLKRVKQNEQLKKEAREKKIEVVCKRLPVQPKGGEIVRRKTVQEVKPLK